MSSWVAKIRGVLGFGTIGTALGAIVGGGCVAVWAVLGGGMPALDEVTFLGTFGAAVGAVAGVGFASLLAVLGSRTSLEGLSAAKTGVWGAIAGVVASLAGIVLASQPFLPTLAVAFPFVALCAGVGALMGWGSVSLAKRANMRELAGGSKRRSIPRGES